MRRFIAPLLAVTALLAFAPAAGAVMFNVTTTADQADAGACGPGDAGCSLREAIVAANTAPSDDTVVVPAGNYVLTRTGSGENNGLVGDLDVKPNGKLTIVGAGARTTVIDANQIDRVIDVLDDSVMDVSGVTITGGFAPGQFGGGVSVSGGGSSTLTTVTVTDAAVVGNEADQGGGLENDRSADLTLTRTTVSGNKANKTGGGIQNVPVVGTATLHVTNSTISDNTQSSPTDPSSFEYGGGGITNVGAVFLDHVTMTGNKAAAIGGGIQQNSGTVTVKNSIVSGNSASSAGTANCDSAVASDGFNLEQGATCGFTQPTDVTGDPKLGSLANNGGPTQTNALGSGSAALDAADPIGCPAIDQRGISRPQGPGCEMGAFERELTDLSLTLADSPDPVKNGALLTYTIKVHNAGSAPARAVTVTDTVASNVSLRRTSPSQGSCTAGPAGAVTCPLGTIPAGGGATVAIGVRPTQVGALTNSASVAGATFDPNGANNSASVSTTVKPKPGRCANTQLGTPGADIMKGTSLGDRLLGKSGNDKLTGADGDDCLKGGSGKDKLYGGKGKDKLSGDSGKDKLKGGKGRDSLKGGKGNDTLSTVDGARDKVDCGKGTGDRAIVDRFDRVKHCETVVIR